VHRRRATSRRRAALRFPLSLLGSAAAHIGLLGALLIPGAASGPRGDGAVQVLLVGGGVSIPSDAGERISAPARRTPRAAVRPGEANAPQRRPSSASAARAPEPSALPTAAEEPVPGPAAPPAPPLPASPRGAASIGHRESAPPAPPLPASPRGAASIGHRESARPAEPLRVAGAGAEEEGGAAAEAPRGASGHPGEGAGSGPGPARTAPGGDAHVRVGGGGFVVGGDSGSLPALRARIEERIVYPAEAVRRGQEGEVLLHIRVGGGGIPQEIRIARSSGARVLDEAARSGVARASPLPSRPGWVEVPVRFLLR
jgi:periplasmic protein TonB